MGAAVKWLKVLFWRWRFRSSHRRLCDLRAIDDGKRPELRDVLAVQRKDAAYDAAEAEIALRVLGDWRTP